ncbi:DUF4347 domain-containing protein [Allomuricauda sp. R78024]|uniref:DUF4347 domain-containing protein n=1 Tax=Allomuricauda sp. R78024 TaxID=3093867 RepID=UPI0037C83C9D
MRKTSLTKNKTLKNYLFFCIALTTITLHAQSADVVIVDKNFPNVQGLLASLPVDVQYIETTSNTTIQEILVSALNLNQQARNIHLFCNTDSKSITVGNQNYSSTVITENLNGNAFINYQNVNLLVYSCNLAKDSKGIELLEMIASKTNFNVASCFSCETVDEEFTFDFSTSSATITTSLFK